MFYVMPRIRRVSSNRPVFSVKRSASPSPATGSAKAHEMEQKTLITLAFSSTGGNSEAVRSGRDASRLGVKM